MNDRLTEDFVIELFKACITKKEVLESIVNHVDETYFPNEHHKRIWEAIASEFSLTGRLMTLGTLKLMFRHDFEVNKVLSVVKKAHVSDFDTLVRGLEQFIKQNLFVHLYDKGSDIYNQGQKEDAYAFFHKNMEKLVSFSLSSGLYEPVIKGFKKRHDQRVINTIEHASQIKTFRYGIEELDYQTGGFETKQSILLLGRSGIGKTQALIHFGIQIARQGGKVAHFQIEDTKEECEAKYDAAWTGILNVDVKAGNIEDKKMKKLLRIIENFSRGDIYIKAYESFDDVSMGQIYIDMKELIRLYGDMEGGIMDYMDLVNPAGKLLEKQERHRQRKVAREWKKMGMEFNTAQITATQSSSVSPDMLNDPDFYLTRYNLSEDKGKIEPFNTFITLNQTLDEQKQGIIRLWRDKDRNSPLSDEPVKICTAFGRNRFYSRKKTMDMLAEEQLMSEE